MTIKDFDAARRERLRERDPLQFVLQGDTYTCVPVVPVGDALDLADAPDVDAGAAFMVAICAFVDKILVDDDRPKFAAAIRRRDDPVDPMTLLEIVEWLSEEYVARPTSPSDASSDGPGGTGQTSSSEASAKASGRSTT